MGTVSDKNDDSSPTKPANPPTKPANLPPKPVNPPTKPANLPHTHIHTMRPHQPNNNNNNIPWSADGDSRNSAHNTAASLRSGHTRVTLA
eukprot:6567722-Pyramimonas_sp.AAC.1